MKRTIIFAVFIILSLQHISAQSRFRIELDYGYMFGLTERDDSYKISRSLYKMHTNSIRLSGIYRLSTLISLGAGIGLERYEEPGYNTFPVFAILRYTPLSSLPKGYIYTDLGYSMKTSTMTPGLLWDLGIGHLWMFRKHFGLKAQAGYNLKQFKTHYWISGDSKKEVAQWRHSLTLSIGLVF
jgi:hypothetical protein